ncbi:MAG: hypothetical protein V1862_05685 [Methanobacteriota archaeon]
MIDDHTTIAMGSGTSGINRSAMLYRDSSMSNGGALLLNKKVGTGSGGSTDSIEAQKVLSYNSAGTGSHIAVSDDAAFSSTKTQDSDVTPICAFASGSEGTLNQSTSASASLDIINANTLQLTTSTRITPGDLQYSVIANTSLPFENYSSPATIVSSFTYDDQTADEMNRVTDRSKVSGIFDLFNRVYRGGKSTTIQAQTQTTSGMVSSKTTAEHTYAQRNGTDQPPEWSGSMVYAADSMTNGGSFDEIRTLSSEKTISSQRALSYLANGSTSMQTEERIVALKEDPIGNDSATGIKCVFAGENPNITDKSPYQSIVGSSQVFGVDSAQISSTAKIDMGSDENGSIPLKVDYKVDITSPVQFDAMIVQVMTDPDKDGKYEDLNGNGRQDIQDLVLLFKNFEWLSKSSLSPRFDFNNNGRVDLADLTQAFKDVKS